MRSTRDSVGRNWSRIGTGNGIFTRLMRGVQEKGLPFQAGPQIDGYGFGPND